MEYTVCLTNIRIVLPVYFYLFNFLPILLLFYLCNYLIICVLFISYCQGFVVGGRGFH